jgi:lipid II:glycine glycyltransferase (peptidoglycan interpeptide bridge formation enzyme)
MVRSLMGGGAEAFSSYGYGGLYGDPTPISDDDLNNLTLFLAKEGICCLFLRHAPFLDNHRYWPDSVLEINRYTYQVALSPSKSIDAHLRSLPQKLRASVNRAKRGGLRVEAVDTTLMDQSMEKFCRLYNTRMSALDSDAFYRFDLPFFMEHKSRLGKACRLLVVKSEASNAVIAGALFLADTEFHHVHYHLSAADHEAMRCQAMELLMSTAIYDFGVEGFSILHLGGGQLLDETDGLSRFKRKFASHRLDFFISKIICDPKEYERLRGLQPLRYPSRFLIGDARGGVT